jgi:hypothetical protein
MAFNGGCDTNDGGPHNKRLCTGQNNTIINDNNNNTNGSGISNGTNLNDVDMNKGLGLLRVNFTFCTSTFFTLIIFILINFFDILVM